MQGIVDSIVQAHESLQDGYVTFNEGELLNANINRSPRAYLLNPEEERRQYKYDVDKTMTLLGLHDTHGRELGFINWYVPGQRQLSRHFGIGQQHFWFI